MEWQTVASVGIATLCGIWVLWRWLRPLLGKRGGGCTLCDECSVRDHSRTLMRIDPAEPRN